jgi:hypothetical protein
MYNNDNDDDTVMSTTRHKKTKAKENQSSLKLPEVKEGTANQNKF